MQGVGVQQWHHISRHKVLHTPPQAINARNMEQTRRELLEVATVNLPRVAFTKVYISGMC